MNLILNLLILLILLFIYFLISADRYKIKYFSLPSQKSFIIKLYLFPKLKGCENKSIFLKSPDFLYPYL